jgi:virulence-associated protein VagC
MRARELLERAGAAGFTVVADGDALVIRPASRLTDELRAELRAAKPELLAILTRMPVNDRPPAPSRPYRLSKAEADAAHVKPWDDASIGQFVARVSLFLRRGISATDADDLAQRLHLRDLQADDRRLCLECRHLVGRRCASHLAAGVGRDLPEALVMQLQRCPEFKDSAA